MKEEQLNFGVVGLGKMGILHSCILNVLSSSSVVALCEKSRMTRRLLRRIFKEARIVDDVVELADLDLDAVFVTTPIPSHFAVVEALCENKVARNLFIEKTLAANYEEAKKLCMLVKGYDSVNMVGYLRRFYVTFRKAKQLLLEKAIGEIANFKAYGYSADFEDIARGNPAPILRGGVLRDLGCHAIDLALWFFGPLTVCSAKVEGLICDTSEDVVSFRVTNSARLEGEFKISWCEAGYRMPEVGFSIVGSEGTIEVSDDRVRLSTKTETREWYRHDLSDNVNFWLALPEYYREDLHFVESIRHCTQAEPDFEDASEVDKLINEITECARRIGQQ